MNIQRNIFILGMALCMIAGHAQNLSKAKARKSFENIRKAAREGFEDFRKQAILGESLRKPPLYLCLKKTPYPQ